MPANTMQQAVQFANDHESTWDREVTGTWGVHQQDPPPWNRLSARCTTAARSPAPSSSRARRWCRGANPKRADLTFSVAKTYLALLAGVAHDRGLLPDVNEPIGARVKGIGFDSGNNAKVTWAQMLQQTSEWDRRTVRDPRPGGPLPRRHLRYAARRQERRPASAAGAGHLLGIQRRAHQPAVAGLAALFQRPLPEVFREAIMRPIGAGENWNWVGYDDAWVDGGRRAHAVGARRHALGRRPVDQCAGPGAGRARCCWTKGSRDGKRVLSAQWIRDMRKPGPLAPYYGYLVWLNHERKMFPSVPASSYFAVGAGSSFTWIEPERKMVVVVRWLNSGARERVLRQGARKQSTLSTPGIRSRLNEPAAPQTAVGLERPVSTPHHPRICPAWPCPKGLRC